MPQIVEHTQATPASDCHIIPQVVIYLCFRIHSCIEIIRVIFWCHVHAMQLWTLNEITLFVFFFSFLVFRCLSSRKKNEKRKVKWKFKKKKLELSQTGFLQYRIAGFLLKFLRFFKNLFLKLKFWFFFINFIILSTLAKNRCVGLLRWGFNLSSCLSIWNLWQILSNLEHVGKFAVPAGYGPPTQLWRRSCQCFFFTFIICELVALCGIVENGQRVCSKSSTSPHFSKQVRMLKKISSYRIFI